VQGGGKRVVFLLQDTVAMGSKGLATVQLKRLLRFMGSACKHELEVLAYGGNRPGMLVM